MNREELQNKRAELYHEFERITQAILELEQLLNHRVPKDKYYYTVLNSAGEMVATETQELHDPMDDSHYVSGNYFKTMDEAQYIADRMNTLLLANKFVRECTEFPVDWNTLKTKWFILYDHRAEQFKLDTNTFRNSGAFYFPTQEIAEKFLNKHMSLLEWMKK